MSGRKGRRRRRERKGSGNKGKRKGKKDVGGKRYIKEGEVRDERWS